MVIMSRFMTVRELYDEHTLLLLHGEDLIDSSVYGRAITNYGVTIASDKSKFGGKSLYFNGAANMIIPFFDFCNGNKDFTLEWWEYRLEPSAYKGTVLYQNKVPGDGGDGLIAGYHGNGYPSFGMCSSTGSWDMVASNTSMGQALSDQWVHRAIVRSGSTITMYQNGVRQNSVTVSKQSANTGYLEIGAYYEYQGGGGYFKGYIDELRISDVARWTENFTPPDKPYADGGLGSGGGQVSDICAVTLAGSMENAYAYAKIGGVTYTTAQTLPMKKGTEVYVYVASKTALTQYCYVKVNGSTVLSGAGGYTYTVENDCTITFTYDNGWYLCNITTS